MSGQETTRVKINLTAKGTDKAEAQANDDLNKDDPDPAIGQDIVEQVLGETGGRDDGEPSSAE